MLSTVPKNQQAFYREFLMARTAFNPEDFGVQLSQADFMDRMVDEFGSQYRGVWTIDELLLHPREALRFCDDVRHKYAYFSVPDDVILRSIMIRRKNPGG